MMFDTDVMIWVQRGNKKAAKLVSSSEERYISLQTYLELLQCAKSKKQHKLVRDFLTDMSFVVLPLSQNIGHRAAVYIEEYGLSHSVNAGDALIAATAVENNLPLSSANTKHFSCIKDLQLKTFNLKK